MTRTQALVSAMVMLGSFVSALDVTIVGTVMPTVIGELGGIDRYAWAFSAYLLVSTVATPLYGAIADNIGRKPLYVASFALFGAGSALCGVATSMDGLIASRAVQGLGAGGLLPIGLTMLGDIFDMRTRAKIQGLFGSVWAFSAVVGPTVGGLFAEKLSWRWAFFVNLPVVVLAIAVVLLVYREHLEPHERRIDWLGAASFAAATLALFLALNGAVGFLAVPFFVLFGVLFVWQERRVPDPMLRLELLRNPLIGVGLTLNVLLGAVLLGLVSFLPPFVQGVQGRTPLEAGAALSGMNLGWPAASAVSGIVMLRTGVRRTALAGTAFIVAGSGALALLVPDSPWLESFAGATLVGLGMGFIAAPLLVAAQSEVAWSQRGVVTGFVMFSRSLGSAFGVAAMGTLLNASLGPDAARVGALLLHSAADPGARDALAAGLHAVYLATLIGAGISFLLATRLPARAAGLAPKAATPARLSLERE